MVTKELSQTRIIKARFLFRGWARRLRVAFPDIPPPFREPEARRPVAVFDVHLKKHRAVNGNHDPLRAVADKEVPRMRLDLHGHGVHFAADRPQRRSLAKLQDDFMRRSLENDGARQFVGFALPHQAERFADVAEESRDILRADIDARSDDGAGLQVFKDGKAGLRPKAHKVVVAQAALVGASPEDGAHAIVRSDGFARHFGIDAREEPGGPAVANAEAAVWERIG